jgi:hypothetical protein
MGGEGKSKLGKRVDCPPPALPPALVTMATKPNQNVTGAASSGREPGRIITRSSTLSTRLYPSSVDLLQLVLGVFLHKGKEVEGGGGGGHDIDGDAAVGVSQYSRDHKNWYDKLLQNAR